MRLEIEYANTEKKVIKAYRTKEDLQQAVDILLGIEDTPEEQA